jgi:hypothetical protein
LIKQGVSVWVNGGGGGGGGGGSSSRKERGHRHMLAGEYLMSPAVSGDRDGGVVVERVVLDVISS